MDVIGIVGPTCSGKSYIAHNLAKELKALGVDSEIISCDSVQVYKHFDIGTDKVSQEMRHEVPYHLIDILEPDEGRFSAGEFRKMFDKIVSGLVEKGKIGILVGGTGLYYKAVKVGMFEGPSADPEIREKLYKIAKEKGPEFLYYRLKEIDPDYANKITKNDTKRIVRALEVFELTGKKFSELHKTFTTPSPFKIYSFFIMPDREKLYNAVNERVDRMIAKGLVKEVRWIVNNYGKELHPLTSIGYKEVLEYLEKKISFEKMVRLIKKHTRNLAKRQITLFKNTSVDETILLPSIDKYSLDMVVKAIIQRLYGNLP